MFNLAFHIKVMFKKVLPEVKKICSFFLPINDLSSYLCNPDLFFYSRKEAMTMESLDV